MAKTPTKEWAYYCETLKLGREYFQRRNSEIPLTLAYRALGKYHEISMQHIQRMNLLWSE